MEEWTVNRLTSDEYDSWNQYVRSHPEGSINHTSDWLAAFGNDLYVYTLLDETHRICGGIALVKTKRYGIGGFHGLPYTALIGPLITPSTRTPRGTAHTDDLQMVQRLLTSLPKVGSYDFTVPGTTDMLPYIWNGFQTDVRYHYIAEGTYDEFMGGMAKKKKQNLKQALREVEAGNLIVEPATPENIVEMLCETRDMTGFNVPVETMQKVFRFQPKYDCVKTYAVRDSERHLLAMSYVLYTDTISSGVVSAVSNKYRNSKNFANLIVYHAMIKDALDSGRKYNFSGSVMPGIEGFFRLLGATPYPVYRVQKATNPIWFAMRAFKRFQEERKGFRVVE